MIGRIRALCLVATTFGLVACGSSSTSGVVAPQPTATGTFRPGGASFPPENYRVVNGSPGIGSVDVYLYPQGNLRPPVPTYTNVAFGTITPFVAEVAGIYTMDVLRTGAAQTSTPIISSSGVNPVPFQAPQGETTSANASLVISGTGLNGTRAIQLFVEPFETAGQSALVVHHTSPAATIVSASGPIGIGIYSAATFPPGTSLTALSAQPTAQLFSFSFIQNPNAIPAPNSSVPGMLFVTPFPVSPFPAAVGFAVGLPTTSTNANGPLASLIANAALSETANENSPYANQNAITNDTAETFGAATHISEFLIDADQNGNVGLIGTVDP